MAILCFAFRKESDQKQLSMPSGSVLTELVRIKGPEVVRERNPLGLTALFHPATFIGSP